MTIRGADAQCRPIRLPNVTSINGGTPHPVAIDRAGNRFELVGDAPPNANAGETDSALDKAPLPEAA
jgi:hypothetical protein